VSLIALLEQMDRQWSVVAAAPSEQDSFVQEDDADQPGRGADAAGGGCCCVCKARAKGATIIPCSHTFCRGCARELLAGHEAEAIHGYAGSGHEQMGRQILISLSFFNLALLFFSLFTNSPSGA
jgi:hypothetical protein